MHVEEVVWAEVLGGRLLDDLEVSESGELDREVLKSFGGLVDEEDIEDDIELVNLDVCLSVDWVGEDRKSVV